MKLAYLIVFIILCFFSCSSQNYYNDAQVRMNLGLEKRITKKLSLTLDQQNRFYKNVSEFNRSSFDFGINLKLNKWLKLKADYVYIEKRNKQGYFTQRNWFYVAMVLKYDLNKFRFFYRNLAQVRMGPTNSDEANTMRIYDRNKFTIRHETTRRWAFWVASEIYIPLNNQQTQGIDRIRYFLGSTLRTAKGQSLDLYFMLQNQVKRGKWFDQSYRYQNDFLKRFFIYGINYNIEF